MKTITAISPGRVNYYLQNATVDYYVAGGEPPGRWRGEGARKLGLPERVEADHFRSLFEGFNPDGRPLVQLGNGGRRHQPGWDGTLTPPKPVQILWFSENPRISGAVARAHQLGLDAELEYQQSECAWTRRGKNGTRLERCGLIVGDFDHGFSREGDPLFHTHRVKMNIGVRADGTTGTVLSRPFYEHKMVAGALYRATVAAELTRSLGVKCRLDGTSFTIEGVSEEVCAHFSKRRGQIKSALAANGLRSPQAAAVAAIKTRRPKGVIPPRSELFARWRAEAKALGFDENAVIGRVVPVAPDQRSLEKLVKDATALLTRSNSHFLKRELLHAAAVLAQERCIDAAGARRAVDQALKLDKWLRPLAVSRGEERYTTSAVVDLERKLVASALRLFRQRSHGVSKKRVERTIDRFSPARAGVVETGS